MATTELIRYVTDQATSPNLGNNTCYTKPSIWLVYDSEGAKGDFGYIMKVCPPDFNIEYEQVFLKYEKNFDFVTGGEVELNNIQLIDGDKVWLSKQSNELENGIYYVRTGTWNFYRSVDDTVFVDLGARASDTIDGDLTREIITEQNINFGEVGFYTINYYVLNSQGVLSTTKRKVKIIECSGSIVPVDTYKITDYLIKAEVDKDVLDPSDILDSCDACELENGGNLRPQIHDDGNNGGYVPSNNNIYIRKDGTITFTHNQSMGGNKLTDLQDPTDPTDAVNLRTLQEYVRSSDTIGNNYTAGENISLHQVVIIGTDGLVYNADSSDLSHMDKVIGITTSNQITGGLIPVVTVGTIDGFTSLNTGIEYFVSSSGALTNIPPSTGFTQIIGTAINSTTFLVDLKIPIGV